jgi:hypothetical protein
MSGSKFASITSSLLARKGEAEPWHEPLRKDLPWQRAEAGQGSNWPPLAPGDDPEPAKATPKTAPRARKNSTNDSRDKTCAVRMTHYDYERLGIMAVKKGTSRQRLMQQALEEFFGRMARDYANECACLSAGCEPDKAPGRAQGS